MRTHTVQPGETLLAIANNYCLTINDILALNPQIKTPHLIYIGEEINVAVEEFTPDSDASTQDLEPVIDFHFSKPNRTIYRVGVHYTASDSPFQTVAGIRMYHKNIRGYNDIGYHYLVDFKGNILEGRDVEIIPAAHAPNNTYSIAICLYGNKNVNKKQLEVLKTMFRVIQSYYAHPLEFFPHKKYAKTLCPGCTFNGSSEGYWDFNQDLEVAKNGYLVELVQ